MSLHRALALALPIASIAIVEPALAQPLPAQIPLPPLPLPQAPMVAPVQPYGAPAMPAPIAPPEPRSTTMMVAGIVMSALGGAMLHAAALYPVLHEDNCFGSSCSNERAVSGGFVLAGAALIAVGVPLLVIGAKHVRPPPTSRGTIGARGFAISF